MVSTFIGLLDIQSWWEIPCISHFCSLFSSAFDLPDIDIEDLESALLSDGTSDEDQVALVPELIVRLLTGCDALHSVANEITHSNYQMFLRRYLRQQCRLHQTENHFDTDIDFQSLPVRKRLQILHHLCHFRLDSVDVQVILSNLEADSLRVEPLGYDSKNSGYWYFYGTRLYREDRTAAAPVTSASSWNSKQSAAAAAAAAAAAEFECGSDDFSGNTTLWNNNTVWQVICFTEDDWQHLASKFKASSHAKERELFQILAENFLPKLPQLFRERERLRRRKLLQVRNSSRLRNLAELKARQEEEREKRELERERERIRRERQTATSLAAQQRTRRRLARAVF
ncbi:GH15633 [Drosophila grimshawi]|uniref:GH15633 n=1 Tax=Drosophila grimshawi TaxID=7222 RepID=B4J098_DROGR|nr:GH15633 [Drosophila grimshawi]